MPVGARQPCEHGWADDLLARDRVGALGHRELSNRSRHLQPVEELPACPIGPEHVKGRVLPMLRNDLVFALGL